MLVVSGTCNNFAICNSMANEKECSKACSYFDNKFCRYTWYGISVSVCFALNYAWSLVSFASVSFPPCHESSRDRTWSRDPYDLDFHQKSLSRAGRFFTTNVESMHSSYVAAFFKYFWLSDRKLNSNWCGACDSIIHSEISIKLLTLRLHFEFIEIANQCINISRKKRLF